MVVVYPIDQSGQVRPSKCSCQSQTFHANGMYFRKITQVIVYCFICAACRKHVSLIPSTCIPYKHHPAQEVESALEDMIEHKKSKRELEFDHLGVHISTLYKWYGEFAAHVNVLATEGAKRLGSKPLAGSLSAIWCKLKAQVGAKPFLGRLQEALCRDYPFLGIFRFLILPGASPPF